MELGKNSNKRMIFKFIQYIFDIKEEQLEMTKKVYVFNKVFLKNFYQPDNPTQPNLTRTFL